MKRVKLSPGDLVEVVTAGGIYSHCFTPGTLCYVVDIKSRTDYFIETLDPSDNRVQILHTSDFEVVWTQRKGYREKN